MTDQLKAIEDSFGKVAPVAEQGAAARGAACGLFMDFSLAETSGRSLAMQ